jgi:hypothetical protein
VIVDKTRVMRETARDRRVHHDAHRHRHRCGASHGRLRRQELRETPRVREVAVTRIAIPGVLVIVAVSCGGRTSSECIDDSNCNLSSGGMCTLFPTTGNHWCSYPDSECPSGYRFSEQYTGDGVSGHCVAEHPVDAGIDAPRDAMLIDAAPGQNRFDVAYVDQWRVNTSATSMNATGWMRIANLGAQSLDVSTMTITNVSDDHAQMEVSVTIDAVGPTALAPGFSSGALTGGAYSLVVDKMNEPVEDPTVSLLRISIPSVAPSGTWLVMNASATLRIGNAYAILPITVTSTAPGTSYTPYTARRVSSTPL